MSCSHAAKRWQIPETSAASHGFSSISDTLARLEKVAKADTTEEAYCGEQLARTKGMKADMFTLT